MTENKVTYVKPTPAALNTQGEALFSRVERGRVELGQPRSNVMFSANLTRRALDVTVRLTLGADNLLDVYPDVNSAATNNGGIFPYSGISPFGFNGRYVYARVSVTR